MVDFNGTLYEHEFFLLADTPGSWLLRNTDITDVAPLSHDLGMIFIGTDDLSLDLDGLDGMPGVGEDDDDDAYIEDFVSGDRDTDTLVIEDDTRPLVFYQVSTITAPIMLTKNAGQIRLEF